MVLGAGALIISELARVEVVSAIRRKSRIEGMSRASADILIATFENDLSRRETAAGVDFTVIRLGQDILDEAILILDRHPLTARSTSKSGAEGSSWGGDGGAERQIWTGLGAEGGWTRRWRTRLATSQGRLRQEGSSGPPKPGKGRSDAQ